MFVDYRFMEKLGGYHSVLTTSEKLNKLKNQPFISIIEVRSQSKLLPPKRSDWQRIIIYQSRNPWAETLVEWVSARVGKPELWQIAQCTQVWELKTPGGLSYCDSPTVLWVLSPGSPRGSQDEKSPLLIPAVGGENEPLWNMPHHLVPNKVCPQEKLLTRA